MHGTQSVPIHQRLSAEGDLAMPRDALVTTGMGEEAKDTAKGPPIAEQSAGERIIHPKCQ